MYNLWKPTGFTRWYNICIGLLLLKNGLKKEYNVKKPRHKLHTATFINKIILYLKGLQYSALFYSQENFKVGTYFTTLDL